MRNVPEFYPEKQGRPKTPELRDLESGQSSVYYISTILQEEYVNLQDKIDELLNEEIDKVQQVLIELKQIKLHLASMSNEDIDKEDVEVE